MQFARLLKIKVGNNIIIGGGGFLLLGGFSFIGVFPPRLSPGIACEHLPQCVRSRRA